MADLEDFFKKKDKKKKGEKKFATLNTDELAANLDQMAVKEEMARKKEISERQSSSRAEVSLQINKKKEREPSNRQNKNVPGKLRNTPKEVAAVELIIRTITTGPVGRDGIWEPIVHFWSIKRVYFFKNANVLNF